MWLVKSCRHTERMHLLGSRYCSRQHEEGGGPHGLIDEMHARFGMAGVRKVSIPPPNARLRPEPRCGASRGHGVGPLPLSFGVGAVGWRVVDGIEGFERWSSCSQEVSEVLPFAWQGKVILLDCMGFEMQVLESNHFTLAPSRTKGCAGISRALQPSGVMIKALQRVTLSMPLAVEDYEE